jgi:hypothetical protein
MVKSKTLITFEKQLLLVCCWLFILSSTRLCSGRPVFHWSFDDEKDLSFSYGEDMRRATTKEVISGADCSIRGLAKYVPGVSGSAMKFDGFSSYVEGRPKASRRRRGENEEEDIPSLAGRTFTTEQDDAEYRWEFKEDGKLVVFGGIANDGKEGTYEQKGEQVFINVGEFKLEGEFDGEEFGIEGEELEVPSKNISVEAWIALGAYPWNWAPILTVGKYKITGFYFGVDGRGRLGFHVSDATSVWHECNSEVDAKTKVGLSLSQWHHVVGTYDAKEGLAIYIDGEPAGTYNNFQFDYGIAYSDINKGFRIGKNRIDLAPSEPIRNWATYPSRYTFDGIFDEIKVHDTTLSAAEVAKIYKRLKPQNEPEFAPRRFPTVKPSGRFGANYTRLKFYPEWDALWPVGDYMDVVVQFDELPTKVMFWRGTRYSACLVSENGKWMARRYAHGLYRAYVRHTVQKQPSCHYSKQRCPLCS